MLTWQERKDAIFVWICRKLGTIMRIDYLVITNSLYGVESRNSKKIYDIVVDLQKTARENGFDVKDEFALEPRE